MIRLIDVTLLASIFAQIRRKYGIDCDPANGPMTISDRNAIVKCLNYSWTEEAIVARLADYNKWSPIEVDFGTADKYSPFVNVVPMCKNCEENGRSTPATFLLPQSVDAGETVTWTPICRGCAVGWTNASDWDGPKFSLTRVGEK